MKISRILSAMFLIFIAGIGFTFAQDNSKKEKLKDKKAAAKTVEVKANLLVVNVDGKLADDVRQEDVKIYEDGIEQKITSFVKKEDDLNIGLVIDNSGSLREIFDAVMFAGSTIVDNLKPESEAFVVRFTSSDKINILQDWTSDKRKLSSQVQNMYVEGGQTAIIDALYLSTEKILEREKQAKSKRYALFLISDGVEADSYFNLEQLLELFKNTDVQIFSFSFPGEKAFKQAKESRKMVLGNKGKKPILLNNLLALETGGTAYTLPLNYTKEMIADALKKSIAELGSQYIIEYTSTNQKRNDKPRSLRVEIADNQKGEKRQVTVRESFVVPEEK